MQRAERIYVRPCCAALWLQFLDLAPPRRRIANPRARIVIESPSHGAPEAIVEHPDEPLALGGGFGVEPISTE
jgi:hypothetical protein